MADNPIKYSSKTFSEIKVDLNNYIRDHYPNVLKSFDDSSVGAMLVDINAGVSNNLRMNLDRSFQETQLKNAQLRNSLLNIAINRGFNIPPRRPSVTVVDFTVTVPVKGDGPDEAYYPTLSAGAQVVGGGRVFETEDIIDWNSDRSSLGDLNRKIVPNLDSNGIIQSYNVTKREVVINGSTNVFKKTITSEDVEPFYNFILPDPEIIEIESVILLEGTNYSTNPTVAEFYNNENRFYEVNYLAQQRIFIDDVNKNTDNSIKAGKWVDVTKKFIKEYTPNGFCKLTFGSGDPDAQLFENGMLKMGVTNRQFLDNFLSNTALGEQLKPNHTLFVRYRTGGGSNSNLGRDVLTELGTFQLNVNGPLNNFNVNVQRSLTVNNPIPAIGGNDGLSLEQIRNLIKYNVAGQNRSVSITDYELEVYKMPGRYGSPFRAKAFKENNKVVISILGINSNGKLSNTSNSLMRDNITEYLSGVRMINDYVEIRNGKIFNLAYDIDVFVENVSNTQIVNNIVNVVKDFNDINNNEMNNDIFLTLLEKRVSDVNGVVNVNEIKVYNKAGGQYSNNVVSQELLDLNTGQIKPINNTIFSENDSMFEVKYPEKDINVFIRKRNI